MEINKEIIRILNDYKINKDAGILVLLGIYYDLDVDKVCPEEIIKAINVTKIVEKNYTTTRHVIKWNIPLFLEQQTDWAWVKDWNDKYGKVNMERKAALSVVEKRMIEFFQRYPKYRKDDIMKATGNYVNSLSSPEYLKNSAAFIFDGAGALKNSMLLAWCEKLKDVSGDYERGKFLT